MKKRRRSTATKNEETQEEKHDKEQKEKHSRVGVGITYGLLGGAVFAAGFSSFFEGYNLWSLAPSLGMTVGIVGGAVLDKKRARGVTCKKNLFVPFQQVHSF